MIVPIEMKVSVPNQLPRLRTRVSQSEAVNYIIQAAFQALEQGDAGHTLDAQRIMEVAAELALLNPVNPARLLLFA